MSNIFVRDDEHIQIVAGGTYTSGTPVLVGASLFIIPETDATSGARVSGQACGVFRLPKAAGSSVTFSLGDKVYWNESSHKATATQTDYLVGTCTKDAADGDTTVETLIKSAAVNKDPAAIKTGTVSVTSPSTSGTVNVGTVYNGKPCGATVQVQGTSSRFVTTAVVASGTLTVTLSGDPGSTATVSYWIDGR